MTQTALDTAAAGDAVRTLRQHGWQVKQHGLRWICKHPGGEGLEVLDNAGMVAVARLVDAQPNTTVDEVIAAMEAAEYGTAPPPPDLPPGSSSDAGAIPLLDLFGALEDHAAEIKRLYAQWGLGLDDVLTRPAALPERFSAPIEVVVPGRYQPRTKFDQAKLDELAASIQEHGILNPLIVFASERGQLELVAGERRLRAARQVGLKFVPVEVRSYTLRQIAEISAIDNLQRDDLTPIEEGVAYERLIADLKLSEAELARRLGKNRAYIQQRRAIAHAAPEVIAALDEGAITFSQARAIAQAAPGEAKAQKAALTKLAELTRQGKRTSEVEARAAAEKVILAKAKKDLQALGWTVNEPYGYFVIWAPSERPRQWTGAEMLEAVKAQRRPAQTPAPATATVGQKSDGLLPTLQLRYRLDKDYTPWIGLAEDWGQQPTFYAASELTEKAEEIKRDYAALEARAAAAGWTIKTEIGGSYTTFKFRSQQDATHSVYGWGEAVKALDLIERGKISPKPRQTEYQPSKYPCARCDKKVSDYRWLEGAKYCPACAKIVESEVKAREKQVAAEVAAILGPWLAAAPPDALRLLVAALPGRTTWHEMRRKTAEQIKQADAAALTVPIIDWVARAAVDDHAHPVYAAGDLVAATIPAPASAASWEDGPLAGLWRNLSRITGWIDRAATEPPTLAAIEGNRDNLAKLADNLEELADDPDLADEEYEALAQAIGDAELRLDQLAEVGAAPTLAEVEA